MKEINCTKISDLKKQITQYVCEMPEDYLPVTFLFKEGLEYSKYKIVMSIVEEDFFIDRKGTKWIKEKE